MHQSDTLPVEEPEVPEPHPLAQRHGSETDPGCETSEGTTLITHCANCTAPLLGPHCYACGQPEKSLVRQFPELIGDFFSTVFGLDSRIARTFGPLLLKPGFLSNEYFAGRRVRYVSPVRLFVFLCLTAFFAANLSSDWGSSVSINPNSTTKAMAGFNLDHVESSIAAATTVDEVLRLRDQALQEIHEVQQDSGDLPGVNELLLGVEQILHQQTNLRIVQLDPQAAGKLTEQTPAQTQHADTDAVPSAVDAWFDRQSARLTMNLARIQENPNLLKDALFGVIPSALFIMLPIFALSLSLLYLFSRRLYMEHLIVALHSHAFLSLALLLSVLLLDLRAWLTEPDTLVHTAFNLGLLALALWVPVYLLLMQKRVYRQSWPLTALKYSLLGVVYLIMLGFATAVAGLATVASF
ncbi:DUF3667 domain-containing protein [Microbulbifer elongatus]|uniref:DUF3667 domain-containing protein n=1 Tax=Microbulbifer elongatus TaxID=86173 RepID=UPI001CFE9ACE|nr:DUF3667 domain-containing protein [Microbulbifer elongatus]